MNTCPFCERTQTHNFVLENDLAVAFFDTCPLNPGHALVIPRRHEANLFALSETEAIAIWRAVELMKIKIEESFSPQGYNAGVNIGAAAGQTVDHLHVHLIPRYIGDVQDPRGGIRWIIPARARYWK